MQVGELRRGQSRRLSAPTVQGVITGGAAQITGDFTEAEAEALARRLGGS